MRSRYRVHHPDRAHFVTCTIVEWLPVFTSSACCDIVLKSLRHCRHHKSLKIYAWVILDNHFHAILAAPDLSAVLRDLNSFTAQESLAAAREGGSRLVAKPTPILSRRPQPNRYQVWQEGSHPQVIMDDTTMLQKLEYLHNNPVKRGWVTAPEHWCYSSAHEWLTGAQPLLRCDDWR
jgi:REP-associated tyrosine transposase